MKRTQHGFLSPRQLGALTGGGVVEIPVGKRRTVRLACASSDTEVANRIATTDDGEEYDVLLFPADVFDDVLDALGKDPEETDQVKLNGMIWRRRPAD